MYYLASALSAQSYWDPTTQKVTVSKSNFNLDPTTKKFTLKDSINIDMVIGSNVLAVNGQSSRMDVAPVIVNGRTYLPARGVAKALGYTVSWDATTQTVSIKGNSNRIDIQPY